MHENLILLPQAMHQRLYRSYTDVQCYGRLLVGWWSLAIPNIQKGFDYLESRVLLWSRVLST
jgi:hypothetical protein